MAKWRDDVDRIEIFTDEDYHDCETCGSSWAEGGRVVVDGVEIINLPARAHCFGGQNFNENDLCHIHLKTYLKVARP